MKRSDFDYHLPAELIAQEPLPTRSASRLLHLPRQDPCVDRRMDALPDLLAPGDLLIFNDTRVLPARLHARKTTGGRAEILIERVLKDFDVKAMLGVSKKPRAGDRMHLADGSTVEVLDRDGQFFVLRFDKDLALAERLKRIGSMPLPPYIDRQAGEADADRYQTVFAREDGAVAAPTAGLHFDSALLAALQERGVAFGYITLHVGAGTFQPVRVDEIDEHTMHSEWLSVDEPVCRKIRATRERGGRVVAVGTTVMRALESARQGSDEIQPYSGETRIFIHPGYRFASADLLLTNFHLPESTLLMLVSAFAGRERVLDAYEHAIAERYRFFSYGDAMLVEHAGVDASGMADTGPVHA